MAPRLIAISGPLKGATTELVEDEVSLGREASNTIHLRDLSVSRRHCVIKRKLVTDTSEESVSEKRSEGIGSPATDYEFTILDLESYNGTFANGVPVHEQRLAHGDQIALGDVVLLFLTDEAETGTMPPVPNEPELITRSTIRLRREDAVYLRPDTVAAELPPSDRLGRDLATLLTISTSIGTICDAGQLQNFVLERIREVIPAERAAVVVTDGSAAEPTSIVGWSKSIGPDNSLKPSRSITQQVLREGVALLSNDVIDEKSLADRQSLAQLNICSVLCVPMSAMDETLGVIYLDTSNPAARFDEHDLQLLTAIAGIGGIALANARRLASLEDENRRLQDEINLDHKLVGESDALRAVIKFIAKVSPTDATVLIRGESGTGKELAARAIHLNSSRAAKPFVAINCATLTETLIESELFGHEKGAFTGAVALKRGKLEVADGGTLFLDEVAELAPQMQAKLLRVLQEREFERVGGTRPIKVDVRIITATNQDLAAAIKANRFREDLYYRLNVVSVTMPPLRERREDIPLLASYFIATFSKKCKRKVRGVSAEARAVLQRYDWPGNVRELENAIECAVVLGMSDLIAVEDLPERLLENVTSVPAASTGFYQAVADAKKQLILGALREAGGNYTQAAKALGVHPNNLHRLIRALDLKPLLKQA